MVGPAIVQLAEKSQAVARAAQELVQPRLDVFFRQFWKTKVVNGMQIFQLSSYGWISVVRYVYGMPITISLSSLLPLTSLLYRYHKQLTSEVSVQHCRRPLRDEVIYVAIQILLRQVVPQLPGFLDSDHRLPQKAP